MASFEEIRGGPERKTFNQRPGVKSYFFLDLVLFGINPCVRTAKVGSRVGSSQITRLGNSVWTILVDSRGTLPLIHSLNQ